MTISNLDQLVDSLANNSSQLVIDKASLGNSAAGQLFSLWRSGGSPAQGAIPGSTPAVPTNATTGAFAFTQQTAPATSYLAQVTLTGSNALSGFEIHDRIAHMGGLSFAVSPGAQNITGLDLAPGGLNPPAARLGASDYSDAQWFLEVYTDGGATASNATINVTYGDNSSGNLTVLAVGGTLRAGRLIPLTPLIPTADQGKRIRQINSVTLSASTGTAGNFGFTCLRQRATTEILAANKPELFDWQRLGLPEIANGSCLQLVCVCSATLTGTVRGFGKVAHG
jgi:hypothetical protein